MTGKEYQLQALRTMANQRLIRIRVFESGTRATQLENAARGLSGDSGEFSSAIQKWLEYGKPLDVVNLKEELGDCLWRIAQACDALGTTLEEIMEMNVAKLAIRYEDKFTDHAANNRDLDNERKALEQPTKVLPATEMLEQDGHGWAEPRLSTPPTKGWTADPPRVPIKTSEPDGTVKGLEQRRDLALAYSIASMLEGRDYERALKMIREYEAATKETAPRPIDISKGY